MKRLKALREQKGKLATQIRALADKENDAEYRWSAEDEAEWQRVNAEYNEVDEQIRRAERALQVDDERRRPAGDDRIGRDDTGGRRDRRDRSGEVTEEHRAVALQAWFRRQAGEDLTDEQRDACRRTGLNPTRRNLTLGLPDTRTAVELAEEFRSVHPALAKRHLRDILAKRALSAVSGSAGAYTVPEGFVSALEVNMLAFGGMLQVAELIRTESGNDMPWPTADDTSNEGEIVGESKSVDGSTDPTFGAVIWKAYKFSSKMVKVPIELLEDSAFNLAERIGAMLGERLGRAQNRKYTTGSGANEPTGWTNAATLGVTAASATSIDTDELFDLEDSVDPAYRDGASFMMHSAILTHLRKKKDTNGAYIWQPGLRLGVPDTLLSHPYTLNQHMASSVATGNITVGFGQYGKYKVRQVRQVRLRRLSERYADNDQEAFIAFLRADGNLLDAGTAPLKFLQQL